MKRLNELLIDVVGRDDHRWCFSATIHGPKLNKFYPTIYYTVDFRCYFIDRHVRLCSIALTTGSFCACGSFSMGLIIN